MESLTHQCPPIALDANLSDLLKSKIRKGDFVNLLIDDDDDDDDNDDDAVDDSHQQLSLVKPSQPNRITTIGQWLSAFTVYAAVLTEHSPQLAPGIFKHISDITEMARKFGGLAWKRYDESFRRDMRANQLSFGQVNWDLRFRCLEQAVNKPGAYSFRGTNTHTPYNRTRGGVFLGSSFPGRAFQKGQCYQFEQFGSCPRPACQFKHACAKCSGFTVTVIRHQRWCRWYSGARRWHWSRQVRGDSSAGQRHGRCRHGDSTCPSRSHRRHHIDTW